MPMPVPMSTPVRGCLAVAAVAGAAVLGSVAGAVDWGRPRQLLRAPYVTDVPGGLLAAFVTLALVGLLVAAALHGRLAPRRTLDGRTSLVALVAVAGATAAAWGGLYATAVENAIPVFDWAFFAVPVALASVVERGSGSSDRSFTTAVLVAVPVAAVNALGWSVYFSSPLAGLTQTAVVGGIGLLLALVPALTSGRKPRPNSPSA